MKNKGFVFVETIVVVVVLSIGLVMVYQSFNNVLTNNKRRAAYNDIAYLYRTYYIQDFITSLNIEKYVNHYLGTNTSAGELGKSIQEFSCQNPLLYNIEGNVYSTDTLGNLSADDQKRLSQCQNLLLDFKVRRIYITKYNVNELKKCTTRAGKLNNNCKSGKNQDALNTMSPSMIYYLRTLNGIEDDAYRVIVEYEEEVVDSDSSIKMVNRNGTLQCPSSFEKSSDGKTCYKKVKKRYYSNVAMVAVNKELNGG